MRKLVLVLVCVSVVAALAAPATGTDRSNRREWLQRYLADAVPAPPARLLTAFGYHDLSSVEGPADAVPGAEVDSPSGIATRGDEIVVASAEAGAVVAIADGKTATIGEGLPRGRFTSGATGVAVDAAGTVYAAGHDDGSVRYFPQRGEPGVYAAGLGAPVGIAFDSRGSMVVADAGGKRVLVVPPNGTPNVLAEGFEERPFGVVVDRDGAVYVSTHRDGRIFKIDSHRGPRLIATVPEGGTAEGLVVDGSGGLYVGDGATGRIHFFARGSDTPVTVVEGLNGPINLAAASDGTLVAAVQETRFKLNEKTEKKDPNVKETQEPAVPGNQVLKVTVETRLVPPHRPVVKPRPVRFFSGDQSFNPGGQALAVRGRADPVTALDVGREAIEPTVGITSKGNVFVTATVIDSPLNRQGKNEPNVYASFDRGRTFEDRSPNMNGVKSHMMSYDPYIHVDADTDRIFNLDLDLACNMLSFSDDEGDSWKTHPLGCGWPFYIDHPSLTTGKPTVSKPAGYPNVVYICYAEGISNSTSMYRDTVCSRSRDGGRTFEPDKLLAYPAYDPETGGKCGPLSGHAVTGPNGWLYVPRLYCKRPFVAISKDEGESFERIWVGSHEMGFMAPNDIDNEAAIGLDTAGNAYFTYIGPGRVPYLVVSRDGGFTWGEPMMINPPEVAQANLPAIAVGEPGEVAVSFYGTANRCCYLQNPDDPGRGNNREAYWSTYLVTTRDALSKTPAFFGATVHPRTDPSAKRDCHQPDYHQCDLVMDFLDVQIDSRGVIWSSSVDACSAEPAEDFEGNCIADAAVGQNNQRGIVAHFRAPASGRPLPHIKRWR